MKSPIILLIILIAVFAQGLLSCSAQRTLITEKTGATLWSENCIRCHKNVSPADFSDNDWETIGLHMRVRAFLTKEETDKIVAFLKESN